MGEAIRGNVNAAVDAATGDRASAARHENIASRGVDEVEHGHYHGARAGAAQPGYGTHAGATHHGTHATNVGNQLDPTRLESDLDARGPVSGSSSYGAHRTGVEHEVDPRYEANAGGMRR